MTPSAKHTPTPYHYWQAKSGDFSINRLEGKKSTKNVCIGIRKEEDASFIVKACNAYEKDQEIMRKLAKSLDDMLTWALANRNTSNEFIKCHTYNYKKEPIIERAKQAIAKAEEK